MSPELELLLESCKSEHTKKQYSYSLKKFFNFVGGQDKLPNDRKQIEDKIIEFIVPLKKEGMSYYGISNYIVPIKSYYAINDITLNLKKIGKFMSECKRARKDRAYTHKEISNLLEIADERMRSVILLLASTGMRIGAIPTLKISNLDNTKITVYENDKEESHTFITPECKQALDSYLDMRSRYGEKLNDDSYLIREQFDVRCPAKPKQFKREALQYKLYDLCKRCGIDKKDIAVAHGFRKFFTTQLVNSKINPEIREMLLGHKIGLASAYYRPTEQEMLDEYQKAANNLTINEENRLKIKVKLLEGEKTNYEKLDAKIDAMQRQFFQNNVTLGGPEGVGRPPTDEEIEYYIQRRRARAKVRRKSERRILEEIENESRKNTNLTKICCNLKLPQNIPIPNKELKALQPRLISYTKTIL